MANKTVKAADVARHAGVDRSTVSRVLNRDFGGHAYSPQTIEKVEEAAKALGYRPSATARALRLGKSMLVGLVVSDIGNPFFAKLASSIERLLGEGQYRLLVCNTGEDPGKQEEHLADLASRGVDGLIVSPSGNQGCASLLEANIPLVTVDRPLDIETIPHAGLDNVYAGHLLGKHLQGLGYCRVGIVVPQLASDPTLLERQAGIEQGLGAGGRIVWVEQVPGLQDYTDIAQAVKRRLGDRQGCDVIVGMTNHCTLGALEAACDLGLAVPDDIGLAGIGDFAGSNLMRPAITVVAQPIDEIAAEAVRLLRQQMKNSIAKIKHQPALIKPTLIQRYSLCPQGKK